MYSTSIQNELYPAQRARMQRFGVEACVDIHCHCLPGLDDGPATMAEAVQLCQALANDGMTTVVATPHQMGRFDGRNLPKAVRLAVAELQAELDKAKVPLQLFPGGDVRVDERMPQLWDADRICGIADNGKYILLELPHETFMDLRRMLPLFADRGRTVIVTHPERHDYLSRHRDAATPWIEQGALLQITAGSLLGTFGPDAEIAAWDWFARDQVAVVATDSHNTTRRPPNMTAAIEQIAARFGEATAKRVCLENPLRVLRGEPIVGPAARTLAAGGTR